VEYLKQGGNIHELQRLLGHSDISTTEIYLHVVDKDLESNVKAILSNWE